MNPRGLLFLSLVAICFGPVPSVQSQGSPDIVWQASTPSGIANSIKGVGWAPDTSTTVTFGSSDRWVRTRQADDGFLLYSVLQPIRSGTADQTVYSTDGTLIAVHNSGGGLGYRVLRAVDGVFLGILAVSVDADGLVQFAPDAQLSGTIGGDGSLSRWQMANFTVVLTVGSGYQLTNTTFNFSPDGALQSAAKQGTITIRRRSGGATVRVLSGGLSQGVTPAAFSPDSTRLAAWSSNPNRVTLWRIADGAVLMNFAGSAPEEGVSAVCFSPDGAQLVTTGYLPYLDQAGLWQQKGVIRFWHVADGVLQRVYDAGTGIGVTSPVAWSPDATRFAYGTYDGTAIVARTPIETVTNRTELSRACSLQRLSNGNVLLRQSGTPGTSYHVEVTTNFLSWREVFVLNINSNGYSEFVDTNCHASSLKFYRTWRSP